MGLRLSDGIARSAFQRELGAAPERVLEAERLRRLGDAGLLRLSAKGLRATAAGRARLDAVLAYLLNETTTAGAPSRAAEARADPGLMESPRAVHPIR